VSRARTARRREENEIEFSRIVAFSDGVFAIAITLLVLNLDISSNLPEGELGHALWDLHTDLLTYALSFAVIGRFWLGHHRFFSDVVGFDGRLIGLNLLYLAWIVLIPFSSRVLGDYGESTAAVVLYAANLAAAVLTALLLSADAWRAGLVKADGYAVRTDNYRALFVAAIFLATIPLAFVAPGIAPFFWLALFAQPLVVRARDRETATRR
jgi:TMEM175 potassium channel family protein